MNKLKNLFIANVHAAQDTDALVSHYALGLTNLLALILYLIMLVIFMFLGIPSLVIFSAVNVVLQIALIGINRKGRLILAAVVPAFTVILYIFIITCLVGWEAGFQWYILAAVIPQYLFVRTNMGWKLLLTTVGVSAMVTVFFINIFFTPVYNQADNHILRFLNLLLVVGTLISEIKMNDIAYASSVRHHAEYIEELEKRSMVDPLTGLWNRRYAERLFDRLTNCHSEFCIALLDIDNFKKINDSYGHSVGDQVLMHLSNLLITGFRSSDKVIRWGGEEFLVVLQHTALENAQHIMAAFCERVAMEICESEGHKITFTITIGVAEYEKGGTVEEVIERSDFCLYQGKRNGKNQVVVYPARG